MIPLELLGWQFSHDEKMLIISECLPHSYKEKKLQTSTVLFNSERYSTTK